MSCEMLCTLCKRGSYRCLVEKLRGSGDLFVYQKPCFVYKFLVMDDFGVALTKLSIP
jgi:hypothetical protein